MKGHQIALKQEMFVEDIGRVGNPLARAKGAENPPMCRGTPERGPCQVDNLSDTFGPCCEPGVMGSAGVTDQYPLFALPGESFEKRNDRVLSYLERKEGAAGSGLKESENRGGHPVSHSNLFAVLEGSDMDGCTRSAGLMKKAVTLVRWFRRLGLPYERDLPGRVECGGLRTAVRQCFAAVSEQWELSFKSIQKVEKNCCEGCEPRFSHRLNEWLSQRFQPVDVDDTHLQNFRRAFRGNVGKGWDQRRRPFIPNGNATLSFKRREAGNWNEEPFSEDCRIALVFSSGKPRVVTLYSARNTELLAPLHYSLYETLQRKGWLLVGDPTEKDIRKLTGTRYLSFDYQSATDMIKTAYVEAAVDILIDQATSLSDDEIRALRVLSALRIEGRDGVATRGQPMGSVMSFPLLCLINKTIVDLALTDLLVGKEISFREWSSHPCLINGDDLLTREVRSGTNLREAITINGGHVGMVVNQEKTMEHSQKAEINSTLFDGCRPIKKLNASALWMKPDVDDVLGLAAEATLDVESFLKVARANAHILSKQQDKKLYRLPPAYQKACRLDRKIRKACTALPESLRPEERGVIPMAEMPEGYHLSREEEYDAMVSEVNRVRDRAKVRFSERKVSFRTRAKQGAQSYSRARRAPMVSQRDLIPLCYADRFYLKKWEDIVEPLVELDLYEDTPFDCSHIDHLVDIIRTKQLVNRSHPGTTEALADFVSVVC